MMLRKNIFLALVLAAAPTYGQDSLLATRPYYQPQSYQQGAYSNTNRQAYSNRQQFPVRTQGPAQQYQVPGQQYQPRRGNFPQNGYGRQVRQQGYGVDQFGRPVFDPRDQQRMAPGPSALRPRQSQPIYRLRDAQHFVPIPPPQQIRKHDIVTIRVDHVLRMESEGNSEMRRSSNYDLALTDWLIVDWFRWIKPSPQSDGDPRIAGTLNRQNRAEGDIDTSERLQFNIATEVREIYPNGNLVLRGGNTVRVNNELWKVSLTGVCRPQDIGPNNTVLSANMLYLDIKKGDEGQVRDAYKRGWFTRWFDRFHPF